MKFLFFDFKILFAIIFIFIISDENVNQVFSQIHVRVAYLFLRLEKIQVEKIHQSQMRVTFAKTFSKPMYFNVLWNI